MQDSAAIIFEDPCIAVCLKPAGLLSQTGEGESMLSLLDRHFAENGEKAKAYPVHRLDRETDTLIGNNALWLAFTLYMFLRGVLQYFMTHSLRTIYRKAGA